MCRGMQRRHPTPNSPPALAAGGSWPLAPLTSVQGWQALGGNAVASPPLLPRKSVPLHGLQKIYLISAFASSLLHSIHSPFSSQSDEQTTWTGSSRSPI